MESFSILFTSESQCPLTSWPSLEHTSRLYPKYFFFIACYLYWRDRIPPTFPFWESEIWDGEVDIFLTLFLRFISLDEM